MNIQDSPLCKIESYLSQQQRLKNNSCISNSLSHANLLRNRMRSMDFNQQLNSNSNSSFDTSKGQISSIYQSTYNQSKPKQSNLSYTIGQNMNISNNTKINTYQNPTYTYNSQQNSYNRLQNQLYQTPNIYNLPNDQIVKKSDGRTNSSHHLNHNSTYQSQNGPFFQNLILNVDSSKSTDTSPQMRVQYNSNNNKYSSSLNLAKTLNQQLNSSNSLIQQSSPNQILMNANSISSGSSTVKNMQNLTPSNQHSQQNYYLNNLYSQYSSQKDGYISNNSLINQQNQPLFSSQKPLSASFTKNQTMFLSPSKKIEQSSSSVSNSINGNLMNNNFMNNSNFPNRILTQENDIIKRTNYIKELLEKKQLSHLDEKYFSHNQNRTNEKTNIKSNNDGYQNKLQQEQKKDNKESNQIDNQITSLNVTEDEGAKILTLDSGSIKSQNQTQQIQNQGHPEKDQIIIQLEKEKNSLSDKVKSLEQYIENNKNLLETQLELERYKLKEQQESQKQQIADQMRDEFKKNEQQIRNQIKEELQKERETSIQKDKILETLQSVMSQNDELFKQYKWIQEKLADSENNREEKIGSDILKSEKCSVSIENIAQTRSHNQNQTLSYSTNTSQKKLAQQNGQGDKQQSKINSEIIQEEEDCFTGTNQEKTKKSHKASDYQTSQNRDSDKGVNECDSLSNSNGSKTGIYDRFNSGERSWNDEMTTSNYATLQKKKSNNKHGSILFTSEGRIEELERIIGAKNHEIQDLKEKLYEAKDSLMQHIPNSQKINIPVLQSPDYFPQKRRKSFSSSSDLHSLSTLQNTRKPIQNSIMEWSYSFDCSGSVEKLLEEGWKVEEHHNDINLNDLNQVIGVIGMPKTGKTTIINGLMKGNLQTVEELRKSLFFEPKLNIVLDDNIAIFEYSYMQPIQIDNPNTISVSSIAELSQQKQFSTIMEEQIQKTNKRDFFWIDFFIKNTQTLIVVFDKFTQEEQKMLSEILNRIENEEELYTKELILIHNYYSKGLKSAQELQGYFGESLQHIDSNFKQKSMVELKMYRTVLVQKNTKSKKCIHISHILNGNLFEPFADKYQHNMLQYCMNQLSQITQSSKKFMQSFQTFLQKNLGIYVGQNNISSIHQIDGIKQYKDYLLHFDSENSSLHFKNQ